MEYESAFVQGQLDCFDGFASTDNPNEKGTGAWEGWRDGWAKGSQTKVADVLAAAAKRDKRVKAVIK